MFNFLWYIISSYRFPTYILNQLGMMPLNAKPREQRAKCLLYLHYMIHLYLMKSKEIKLRGKFCVLTYLRNDRAMIRQICNVKPQDTANIRFTELLAWLRNEDLDLILKERRLRWYGHVERSTGAVKTAFDI